MSDYSTFQPINPMANFQQGYGIGQVIQQNIQAKAMAAAEAKRKEEYSMAFNRAMDTRDPEDYMNLVNLTPSDQRENFIKAWDSMEAKEQQNTVTKLVTRGSAYASGNMDVVKEDLQRDYDAAFNEGDKKGMATAKMQLDAIEKGSPEVAEMINNSMIAMIPGADKYLSNFKTMRDTQKTEQEMEMDILKYGNELEFASPEDYGRAMAMAKKHGNVTAQKMLDLYAGFSNLKGMSAKDIVDAYLPIDKEYNDLVEDLDIVLLNAENLETMGFLEGGAASQALITLYNKVLDPGSVVRQSEYANTAEAAGFINTIKQFEDRVISGQSIGPEAAQRIIQAAKFMANVAEKEKIKIQEDLGKIIDEAGLKREVVFKSAGTLEENNLNKARMLIKASWPDDKDIDKMSLSELKENYPKTFERVMGDTIVIPTGFEGEEDLN